MNVIYAHMQCAPCGYGDMYLNVLCGMYSFEPMFLFGTSSHHIIQVYYQGKCLRIFVSFFSLIYNNKNLIYPINKLHTSSRIRFAYVGI